MRTPIFTLPLLVLVSFSLFGQGNIVNTIGNGGTFSIKDGSATFLSLSQSNGKVGIGTTAPASLVDISASQPDSRLTYTNTANYARLLFAENATPTGAVEFIGSTFGTANRQNALELVNNTATGPINFFTDATERMRITNNGNVGIGTTTPSSKLEVVGNVSIPSANDFSYSSAKPKSITLGNAAFVAVGPDAGMVATHNVSSVAGIPVSIYTLNGPTGGAVSSFAAPVYLPDGAIVTGMTAYVFDSNATYDVTVLLTGQPLGTITINTMASVSSTAGSGTYSTTSISNSTIDNASYSYQVVFQSRANGNHAIFHVKLDYTITKAD